MNPASITLDHAALPVTLARRGRVAGLGRPLRGRTEAGQDVHDLEDGLLDALDHELGDPVPPAQVHGLTGVEVHQRDLDLAAVAGVDGARGGWVGVRWDGDVVANRLHGFRVRAVMFLPFMGAVTISDRATDDPIVTAECAAAGPATAVDVYRTRPPRATVATDGSHTDDYAGAKRSTADYQVCVADSTSSCSNTASVRF